MLLFESDSFHLVDSRNQFAFGKLHWPHIVDRSTLACPLGKLLDLVFGKRRCLFRLLHNLATHLFKDLLHVGAIGDQIIFNA